MASRRYVAFAAVLGLAVIAAASSCTLSTQGELDEPLGQDSSVGGSGGTKLDGSPKDVSKEGDALQDKKSDTLDAKYEDVAKESGCFAGSKWCGGPECVTGTPENGCALDTCAPCNIPNATAKCSNEECAIEKCTLPYADCKNGVTDGCETATNTLSDCTACGSPCILMNATAECNDGLSCKKVACNSGWDDCDASPGCETYTATDVHHCGTCGNDCTVGATNTMKCVNGVCKIDTCTPPTMDCDGQDTNGCEVLDKNTDVNNCGSCFHVCSYPNGIAACVGGSCHMTGCLAPYGDCNNNDTDGCEVNLNTSPTNCGSCAAACKSTHGKYPACDSGLCTLTCDNGWEDCNGPQPGNNPKNDGCEVNVGGDPAQCGACGKPCSTVNGSAPACTLGKCSLTCNPGFTDCDGPASGATSNGCEISTASDPGHCGSCLNVCNGNNGTPTCTGGTCGITCNGGYTDCNSNVGDGCETNTGGDVANCGTCGKVCSALHGAPSCNSGSCAIACVSGWGNCDNLVDTGCETDTTITLSHCGQCNHACSSAQGTPTCAASTCTISCFGGWGNCDGNVSNGCEDNLLTDPAHCNACATACNIPNATANCSNGVCGIGLCNAGRADCNSTVADGCEINKTSDPVNCGACGNVCSSNHGTRSCSGGACAIACDSGYGKCDADPLNGCETAITNDTQHCGSCSNVCPTGGSTPHGTVVCDVNTCKINCDGGYGNCTGGLADGCETQLNSTTNCGACGIPCSGKNAVWGCPGGAGCAVVSCAPGYGNCDAQSGNGCEVNTNTDNANCGACNSPCSTNWHCAGGACVHD